MSQPPTAVAGVPGDGKVTVSWTAPADDGGSPVLDYTATASPGGAACTTTSTSCVVSGLTNGTGYTFTVTARNAIGVSAPSAPSAPVIPQGRDAGEQGDRGQGRGAKGHGQDHLETGANRHVLPGADLEAGRQEVQGMEDHQQTGVQSQGAARVRSIASRLPPSEPGAADRSPRSGSKASSPIIHTVLPNRSDH